MNVFQRQMLVLVDGLLDSPVHLQRFATSFHNMLTHGDWRKNK